MKPIMRHKRSLAYGDGRQFACLPCCSSFHPSLAAVKYWCWKLRRCCHMFMCETEALVRIGLEETFLIQKVNSWELHGTVMIYSSLLCLSPHRYYTATENSHKQGRPVKQAIAGVSLCYSLFQFFGKCRCLWPEMFALFTYSPFSTM